jgi:hypothetical protein
MDFVGEIGFFGVSYFSPWACVGGYKAELMVFTIAPLIGVLAALAGGFLWLSFQSFVARRKGDAEVKTVTWRDGLLKGLPIALLVALLFLPQASSKAFSAFNCRNFDESGGTSDDAFLLADLGVQCWVSGDHSFIRAFAWVMIVVWPIGCTLCISVMLAQARSKLVDKKASEFTKSIFTLHKEYQPQYFYVEVVVLLQRTVLCGALVLIPDRYSVMRLLLAVWFSAVFLVYGMLAKPFLRKVHNRLYLTITFAYVSIFLTALAVFLHNDIETVVDAQAAKEVLGVSSADGFVTLALVFTAFVFLLALSLTMNDLLTPVKTFRLLLNGCEPDLSLEKTQLFHGFISHVWGTGQDATHVVVRQLQALLPGVKIWLDVDCLVDVSTLEDSVRDSAVFMVFLSKGYFASKNCRRELYSSHTYKKPTVLIHEAEKYSLASLEGECRTHCVDGTEAVGQVADKVFNGSCAVVPWVRLGEFQLVSLRMVAFELLKNSSYSERLHHLSSGLILPGQAKPPVYMGQVHLVHSPTNKGAREVAEELMQGALSQQPNMDFEILDTMRDHVASERPSTVLGLSLGGLAEASQAATAAAALGLAEASSFQSGTATHMLLYLNKEVFSDNGETAEMVRTAQDTGVKIVMVHETDHAKQGCEFGHFFQITPEDLIRVRKLFSNSVATALYSGKEHREISLRVIAKELGAIDRASLRRVFSRGDVKSSSAPALLKRSRLPKGENARSYAKAKTKTVVVEEAASASDEAGPSHKI